jgi:hypothetical protein
VGCFMRRIRIVSGGHGGIDGSCFGDGVVGK